MTATDLSPALLFCGATHPLDPAQLCRRLDGHQGIHASDPDCDWDTDTDDSKD